MENVYWEEGIDLRPYIRKIFKFWYWIIGAAIIAAITASIVQSSHTNYEAVSSVAVMRERTNVSFGTGIEVRENTLDLHSRLTGLVALVTSNDVAVIVLDQIKDSLPPDSQTVSDLLRMVDSKNTGDLILITVTNPDPELAALIANTWANVYEKHVNTLFVSGTNANLGDVHSRVLLAADAYEAAQAELEDITGDSHILLLETQIKAKEDLLTTYVASANKIEAAPVEMQVDVRQNILAGYYTDLANIELWLMDAESLRQQMSSNAGAATNTGNALAFMLLRNRIVGGSANDVVLQIDLSTEMEPIRLTDINALIKTLETRREETQSRIQSMPATFADITPDESELTADSILKVQIETLNQELVDLNVELESEQELVKQLTQRRDLLWGSYQSLAKKEQEIIVAGDTGSEVRIASRAITPDRPSGTSAVMSAILAAFVGSLLALGGIMTAQWWSMDDTSGETKE